MVQAVPPMAAKPRTPAMALEAANCLMVLIMICVAFQVFRRRLARQHSVQMKEAAAAMENVDLPRSALNVSVLDGEQFVLLRSRLIARG
jgi:hypothetical protein